MLSTPLSIIAASGFGRRHDAPLVDSAGRAFDLDERFFEVFQNRVRRASRYVKFANLAAHQCLAQLDLAYLKSQRLGFFLGTGLGNTPDIVNFTSEIFTQINATISPANFVNSVSNAGLFYVARNLGTECTTSVVSQETLSFEAALLSAGLMLARGEVDLALVGGVDVLHPPLETAYLRLGSKGASRDNLGEGSAFVALTLSNAKERARLTHVGLQHCAFTEDTGKESVAYGIDHPLEAGSYRHQCGDYSTGSAFALTQFVSAARRNPWWHVNQHAEGLTGFFRVQ